MADLNLVQDDTYPTRFLVSDANGPVNLSTATNIELYLKKSGVLVTANCTADANQTTNTGWATAVWAPTDLSVAGNDYEAEVQVTFPAGKATFPSGATKTAQIRADLGD